MIKTIDRGEASKRSLKSVREYVGELNNPDHSLIFLIGDTQSGKTEILKEYIGSKSATSHRTTVALGCDCKSSLELGSDNLYSFFNFPLDTLSHEYFSLLDYDKINNTDEIIIDGFDFERVDLFLSILRTIRFSLQKDTQDALGGKRIIFSGRPVSKISSSKIVQFYLSASYNGSLDWPAPHVVTTKKDEIISLDSIMKGSMSTLSEFYQKCTVANVPSADSILITDSERKSMNYNMSLLDSLIGFEQLYKGKARKDFVFTKPVEETLHLKRGARVIFTEDVYKKDILVFSKGELATVLNDTKSNLLNIFKLNSNRLRILKSDGSVHSIKPHLWTSYGYANGSGSLYVLNKKGDFSQFPVRLAYSLTVSQCKGLRFNNVFLDVSDMNVLEDFISDWKVPSIVTVSELTYEKIENKLKTKKLKTA